ncbi:MAG: hypothetical protein ACKVOY_05390 [Burkholderiaceae bacterium]
MAQLDLMSQDSTFESKGPNCWQCRNFAITWDIKTPYGCNLMGFKSRLIPSIEVLRADGQACRGFIPKQVKPSEHTPIQPSKVAPSVISTTRQVWEA